MKEGSLEDRIFATLRAFFVTLFAYRDYKEILHHGPVIPVIVVDRGEDAVPLARALVAGGVRVLEFTLRTPAALEAVKSVVREVDEAIVGVGTIMRPQIWRQPSMPVRPFKERRRRTRRAPRTRPL